MKITRLILKNYNRLLLNNIRYIDYRIDKKTNIILGTNGSGKSSLIKEMSPLVFDKKYFSPNAGYKEVHLEHNNKDYVLIQDNKTCSFKEDGVELNQSGTRSVQTSLVKEHLGYDAEFHNLFLGITSFTSMPLSIRKNWIIKLSNIDYNYSMAYFKRLVSRDRDIKGSIKILAGKLMEDKSHALDEELKNKYREDFKNINDLIYLLLENKDNNIVDNIREDNLEELFNINDKLLNRIKTDIPLDELSSKINEIENDISLTKNNLNHNISLLDKANDSIKLTEDNLLTKIKEKESLLLELDTISSIIPDYINKDNLVNIYQQLLNIVDFLYDKLYAISTANIDISIEEYDRLNKERYYLESGILPYTYEIAKASTELQLAKEKEKEEVTCNKCNNVFNPYYSVSLEEELTKKIDTLVKKRNDSEKRIDEILEIENKYNYKQDMINRIVSELSSRPLISTLMDEVMSKYNIQSESIIIANKIKELIITIDTKWLKYVSITNSINNLNKEIEYISNNLNINNLNVNIEQLRLDIAMANKKIMDDSIYLENLKSDRDIKTSILKLNNRYKFILKNNGKNRDNSIKKLKNEFIDEVISYLREEKFILEDRLNKSDMLEFKIKNTSNDILELQNKSRILNVAIDALSPNYGLIAKSLDSFINVFIEDINYVINSIWSYRLELENGANTENNDKDLLTYEFPVRSGEEGYSEDVSLTSTSMKEVINLAFKIVVMKYSNMEDYPLFLDEFGSNMDDVHKVKAYEALDNVSLSTFSQIFIVSHFSGIYNRFLDSDTIVLDNKNISLDKTKEVNKNVIIR